MVSQLTLLFRDKLLTIDNNDDETQNTVTEKGSDSSETKNPRNIETQNSFTHRTSLFSPPSPSSSFHMPLHYPNYTRDDYENMSEEELVRLLDLYGLPILGDLSHKKAFAMGAFLWENVVYDYEQDQGPSSPAGHGSMNPKSSLDYSAEKSTMRLMEVLREMVSYIFRV